VKLEPTLIAWSDDETSCDLQAVVRTVELGGLSPLSTGTKEFTPFVVMLCCCFNLVQDQLPTHNLGLLC
jgi:hypothetical protein